MSNPTLKFTITDLILELNAAFIIFYILTPPNTSDDRSQSNSSSLGGPVRVCIETTA
jgi:hypothetical protein